jgi:excisionase family DNA binding protein
VTGEGLERVLGDIVRSALHDVVRSELRAALSEGPIRNGNDAYLSVTGAARHAAVAPGTIRAWIRAGRLPARRAGRVFRVCRDDLERFLAGGPTVNAREIDEKAGRILGSRRAA